MENKISKYFKGKRLDETRACNIMNVHFLSEDGQLLFYEDCLKIAKQIKKDTEQNAELAFRKSCQFFVEPNFCDSTERSSNNCFNNDSECLTLQYYRSEYAKLDK